MGFALHPYHFLHTHNGQGAEIQVSHSVVLHVYIGDKYRERFPKPGKAPRVLTVTTIFPPSNDNSGTALVCGKTERIKGACHVVGNLTRVQGTSVMAYTLHSHWEKVEG